MKNSSDAIQELTLILLYLNSWEEKLKLSEEVFTTLHSWKNYDFDTLDKLKEQGLIDGSNKSKLVGITKEGIVEAKKFLKEYNISWKIK